MHLDLAILGSGFGGSITALVAKQMGLNPILFERGKHPRFAIGESATPQADIAIWIMERDIPKLELWTKTGVHVRQSSTY